LNWLKREHLYLLNAVIEILFREINISDPRPRMADAYIPLCVDCMALTIDDRIIDHVSKDLLYTSNAECQDQPELMIECQKQDILPSLPNLSAAAEAGCQFCAFLLVFVVKCCLRYSVAVRSVEFSDEEDFKTTQISVKIDRIRYIRKHDPEVAGFADHFPQTGIIGLAADVCIYDENSQEPLLKTTAWLPLSAKTGRLSQNSKAHVARQSTN
jgi:hypothetical protein